MGGWGGGKTLGRAFLAPPTTTTNHFAPLFLSPTPLPPQWAFSYHADFGMFRWDRHDPTSARTPRGSLPTVLRELGHLKRHVEAAWARNGHAVDAAGNAPPGVFVSVAAGVRALAAGGGGRRPVPPAGTIVPAPPARRGQRAKPAAAAAAAPAQKRARGAAATAAGASPPPKRAATRTRAAAAAPAKPAAPARAKRAAPAAVGGWATRARTR